MEKWTKIIALVLLVLAVAMAIGHVAQTGTVMANTSSPVPPTPWLIANTSSPVPPTPWAVQNTSSPVPPTPWAR